MRIRSLLFTCCWAAALMLAVSATGAAPLYQEVSGVEVAVGKSLVVPLDVTPKKVSVGDPGIADIMMMRAGQLYVLGKSLGSTNVMLMDGSGRVMDTLNVQVTYDTETLKRKLHELLPGEAIAVHASQGGLVLSGEVSSAPKMDMAMQLARRLAARETNKPDEAERRVLNMMQVGGSQQVLLEVKVAEISRNFIKRLNSEFNAITTDDNISIGTIVGPGDVIVDPFPGGGAEIPAGTSEIAPGEWLTPFVTDPRLMELQNKALVASFLDGTTLFNIALDVAKEEGLAKVLAEPTLTTMTGKEASFLAGGEFPIPVADSDGSVTVDYKDFGVGLRFLPVVLDSGIVNLNVDVAVSELVAPNSFDIRIPNVSTSFFIPALSKRTASSTVELAHGQTIGIAGLINENLRERVEKFPGLGDIPILGALFRSQEYVKGQTELVIFVTPKFARPIEAAQVRLPTDTFVEPSDAEFYLLGRLQGTEEEEREPMPREGGMEGRFGHDL